MREEGHTSLSSSSSPNWRLPRTARAGGEEGGVALESLSSSSVVREVAVSECLSRMARRPHRGASRRRESEWERRIYRRAPGQMVRANGQRAGEMLTPLFRGRHDVNLHDIRWWLVLRRRCVALERRVCVRTLCVFCLVLRESERAKRRMCAGGKTKKGSLGMGVFY